MPQPNPANDCKFTVCIIGAGPSGLCSLHHLLSSSNLKGVKAVLFEQQNNIGGVWNYAGPKTTLWDSNRIPMVFPMYNDLRCNLPKQLMEFRDFKHERSNSTFVTQKELHDYLMDYANHFQLWSCITLNTRVISVKPDMDGKWTVTVEHVKSFQRTLFTFDAIMCCTGVNFRPKIPTMVGASSFNGDIFHSKFFKSVEGLKDKKVVLLGLGPSAADLCLKLEPVAKQVVVCHRSPGGFGLGLLPPNVRETAAIKELKQWSAITENGEEVPCDVVILCTGYRAHFPFLDSSVSHDLTSIHENDDEIAIINRLYKRMIFPNHPTLCFINAHGLVSEFLVMELQVKYFVALLEGKIELPTVALMEKQAVHEELLMSRQGKLTESLRSGERSALIEVEQYLKGLAIDGGFSNEFNNIPLHLAVWQWVIRRIFGSLAVYRNDHLQVVSPTLWEYICESNSGSKKEPRLAKIFQLCDDGTVLTLEKQIKA